MSNAARNTINWYEIPAIDLARATRFYENVLGRSLKRETSHGNELAIFESAEPGVGGAIVSRPHNQPGASGPVIYLDATGKLDECLARVVPAGGEIVVPKTSIGPMGSFAVMRDTEGNTIGLHTEVT